MEVVIHLAIYVALSEGLIFSLMTFPTTYVVGYCYSVPPGLVMPHPAVGLIPITFNLLSFY